MIAAKLLTLLICYVGGPGTAQQARPVLDTFLRHIERAAGWSKGSVGGVFETALPRCEAAIREGAPQMIVTDLPTYLARAKAWKLTPVAHMGAADAKRYYLLVREGSAAKVAALKGKTVVTTLAAQPRFISRIVFGGKLDAAKHFALRASVRPLKGIRAVARGRADATLVDEAAFAHLAELPLPKQLVAVHRSAPLPGLTLAAVKGRASAKLTKQLVAALPKLCTGPGEKLCRTFAVERFTAAKAALYRRLLRQYNRR